MAMINGYVGMCAALAVSTMYKELSEGISPHQSLCQSVSFSLLESKL